MKVPGDLLKGIQSQQKPGKRPKVLPLCGCGTKTANEPLTLPLLFRTGKERTLRVQASLPVTHWPRHACTRSEQVSAGNDIRHITEGDFHLSCCARSFSWCGFSWEKSWMFGENCACCRVLLVSYCVVQSCRVCVACSSDFLCSSTVIFFVFFFMIMIREYRACFILHSAWRWAHISKTSLN